MSTDQPPVARFVDLNCDIGERPGADGLAADAALLEVITSANIACGGHAGDALTMMVRCEQAVDNGVAIGAQVSFVDREGFGRRYLALPAETLRDQLATQWQSLSDAAAAAGGKVDYLRPHGALYNAAMQDVDIATTVMSAVPTGTPVLCLAGSALDEAARTSGSPVTHEIFADRAITYTGHLVPRGQAGAVLVDTVTVLARLRTWLATGQMRSVTGEVVELPGQSICVHSDTPGSLELARRIRNALESDGAVLRPLTRSADEDP